MNRKIKRFKNEETPTALTVEVSNTRTKNTKSKETSTHSVPSNGCDPQVNRMQGCFKHLSRVVTRSVGKLLADDFILIDPSIKPKIGDVALCGIVGDYESLEVYQGQGNVIGKVVYKWWAE